MHEYFIPNIDKQRAYEIIESYNDNIIKDKKYKFFTLSEEQTGFIEERYLIFWADTIYGEGKKYKIYLNNLSKDSINLLKNFLNINGFQLIIEENEWVKM